ncbi:hypothetical protein D6764_02105 [Candidatus Woesearchaeota archaeon]|nr:MAG: hypothetical protein D6764_02105 [Candidatus Woesearchaeota archaeon]
MPPKKLSGHIRPARTQHPVFKGLSWRSAALAVVLVMLAGSIAFLWYSVTMERTVVYTLPAEFRFGRVVGLAAGSDKLNFGTLPPRSSASKSVDVSASFPARVTIRALGNGSEFISFSDNDFLIVPGMQKRVVVRASSPRVFNSSVTLNYSVNIEFTFRPANLESE